MVSSVRCFQKQSINNRFGPRSRKFLVTGRAASAPGDHRTARASGASLPVITPPLPRLIESHEAIASPPPTSLGGHEAFT